jgi:hypothetical protein
MRLPSGDHWGYRVNGPLNEVNGTAFAPSLSQTQISQFPERFDEKAILEPFGLSAGVCSMRVDEISLAGGLALPALGGAPPGTSTRQML